ncbi:MAG: hypothetical protein MUF49_09430 [Oculatellaceae cyanobacterium Prado106]|nr:hypothetical protein [Oculatellaceae cyanobacterium Prado106]
MTLSMVAAIAYGILAVVGGVMGYANAKSMISLAAGGGCGILLIVAGLLQLQNLSLGLMLAMAVTVVLILSFVMRFLKTRKFMPAGLMLLVGVPVLGILINQWVSI